MGWWQVVVIAFIITNLLWVFQTNRALRDIEESVFDLYLYLDLLDDIRE
jgi:hypothetical protein